VSDVLGLARPDILALQPYQHAAWDPSLERLHANEMPWRAAGDSTEAGLNRYPEPQPRQLLDRLAELYGVARERLLVGRGSDEAIDLLVRAFCRAGADAVVTCPPTFGFYQVAARIQGAVVREAPLRRTDFSLDVGRVLEAAAGAKIVFLCSPNNPTGNLLDRDDVLTIVRELDGSALVCVDEAYVEFAGAASLVGELDSRPNLVLLRTLSKAHALAGARCGALVAQPAIVALLRRIIPPYAVPTTTIEDVLRLTAPGTRAETDRRVRQVLVERERLRAGLESCPGIETIHPSDANFLLVRCRDAARVLAAGRDAALLVRDFSRDPHLAGCLRISVGTPEQNARLLAAVGKP
jgi:histidinol-phosphate aminotransferase